MQSLGHLIFNHRQLVYRSLYCGRISSCVVGGILHHIYFIIIIIFVYYITNRPQLFLFMGALQFEVYP